MSYINVSYDGHDGAAFAYSSNWFLDGIYTVTSTGQSGNYSYTGPESAVVTFDYPTNMVAVYYYGFKPSGEGDFAICVDCDYNANKSTVIQASSGSVPLDGSNPPTILWSQSWGYPGGHQIILTNVKDSNDSAYSQVSLARLVVTVPANTVSSSATETQTSSSDASSSSLSTSSTQASSQTTSVDSDVDSSKHINAGAVAGGAVGGIVALAALILVFFFIRRKQQQKRNQNAILASTPFTESPPSSSIAGTMPSDMKRPDPQPSSIPSIPSLSRTGSTTPLGQLPILQTPPQAVPLPREFPLAPLRREEDAGLIMRAGEQTEVGSEDDTSEAQWNSSTLPPDYAQATMRERRDAAPITIPIISQTPSTGPP